MPWQRLFEATARLPSGQSLDDWYGSLLDRLGEVTPFELAVLGGSLSATPGLAFLAGYQGALRLLWPSAPQSLATAAHNMPMVPGPRTTTLSPGFSLLFSTTALKATQQGSVRHACSKPRLSGTR